MLQRIGRRWIFIPDIAGGSSRRAVELPTLGERMEGFRAFMHSPTGGAGGGQSGSGQGGSGTNDESPTLTAQEMAALRTLINAQGGDQQTLHSLFQENARLKTQLSQAESNQIPANSLILVGQDVETWKQLLGLDIPLNDLKGRLETIGELEGKVARMEREGSLREVAAITGWNADVFVSLDGLDGLQRTYEIRDADGGGKMVFVKEGDNQPVDAASYLQNKWAAFVPSLLNTQPGANGEQPPTELQQGGTVVVQQPDPNQQNQNNQNNQQNGTGGQQLQGTVYLTQPAGSSGSGAGAGGKDDKSLADIAQGALNKIYGREEKKEAA